MSAPDWPRLCCFCPPMATPPHFMDFPIRRCCRGPKAQGVKKNTNQIDARPQNAAINLLNACACRSILLTTSILSSWSSWLFRSWRIPWSSDLCPCCSPCWCWSCCLWWWWCCLCWSIMWTMVICPACRVLNTCCVFPPWLVVAGGVGCNCGRDTYRH